LPFGRAKPAPLEGIRPVAVHQHIGPTQQCLELLELAWVSQVEVGAALAEHDLGNGARLAPEWRIDAEDLCAIPGEETRGYGAGQYAGQVQYLQPRQRAAR